MASADRVPPGRGAGRRPRLWPFLLVLILGLVGGVAFAADRIAVGQAERVSADRLQAELGTPGEPDVDIEGFPFLTQVLGRSFGSVRVGADAVDPPGDGLTVQRLDLHLRRVKAADRFRSLTAGEVDGTADLSYAAVGQLVGRPVSYAGDGRIRVELTSRIGSSSVNATVVGAPSVDLESQTVRLDNPAVTVNGRAVPQALASTLARTLLRAAPLSGIPLGLEVTSLEADEDGVTAGLRGRDVPLSR